MVFILSLIIRISVQFLVQVLKKLKFTHPDRSTFHQRGLLQHQMLSINLYVTKFYQNSRVPDTTQQTSQTEQMKGHFNFKFLCFMIFFFSPYQLISDSRLSGAKDCKNVHCP